MKSAVKISVLRVLLPALLLAAPACRRDARPENPDTPPSPSGGSTTDHAEVFRRAFWRQPAAADRVLQAERRVDPSDASWSWFIQLHPSPGLLAALRDPETFGLRPPGAPGSTPAAPLDSPPAWFPTHAELTSSADFEILQAPASGLVVLYRASDNLLFATDTGTGFAPPAR